MTDDLTMDDKTRQRREATIHAAAYALLAQHGYGGTSMLRIARAAHASNETLYRWYGDKDGLFTAMARENAADTRRLLENALECHDDPWEALAAVAPTFLRMILGDRAILLNRAAAADPTGALGAAISAGGREEIRPLICRLMERLCTGSHHDPNQVTGWFLGVLLGDLQVRRIIHDQPALSEQEIVLRCNGTLATLRRLATEACASSGP
ncbi:TetR/AcrR family transcriptional regulator [Gemmobacter fulvus]|uniref:TetR/AcrR family transcriptional regulator n=1 Tax=Gemmobacter fulvus TaxID=2840474 RepID=UPI002796CDA3|nr:TetR/AcrR family transcriptional regulator [Gemmobacter fulvus]MDQ1850076.1 TetR/AcrR family transcriptional regulator [Gemmobacter fulvus]